MASPLLTALQGLRRVLAECPNASHQLRDAIQRLAAARGAPLPSSLHERQALQVCSELLAVAKELEQLDARLAAQSVDRQTLQLHLEAACDALQTLIVFSRPLQLSPRQLGELACSLVIVLRAGRQLLQALLADWQACSTRGAARAGEAQQKLMAAVTVQLHSVGGVVQMLLTASGMEGEQLFASKAVKVQVVLPWLGTMSETFAAVAPRGAGRAHVKLEPLNFFVTTLDVFLGRSAYMHIPRALTSSPAAQQAIVTALMGPLLERLAAEAVALAEQRAQAADVTHLPQQQEAPANVPAGLPVVFTLDGTDAAFFSLLTELGSMLWKQQPPSQPVLMGAVRLHLRQPGTAPTTMRHTAQVMRALPLSRPPSLAVRAWRAVLDNATALLAAVALSISTEADEEGGAPAAPGTGLTGPHAAVLRREQQEAAAELVRLLPFWADLLLAAASSGEINDADLLYLVVSSKAAFHLLSDQAKLASDAQHCADLAAAAVAAVRLHQLLMRLHDCWGQLAQHAPPAREGEVDPALFALAQLQQEVWYRGTIECSHWADPSKLLNLGAADLPAALPRLLWQLHTASCRLIHSLASSRCHAMVPGGGASDDWRAMQEVLHLQLATAVAVCEAGEEAGLPGCSQRQRQAMCVAHFTVMQAAAAAVSTLQPLPGCPQEVTRQPVRYAADALLRLLCECPALLMEDPQLMDRLAEELSCGRSTRFDLRAAVACLIVPACQSPRLAAAMAASSLLEQLCRQATVRGHQLDLEGLTHFVRCIDDAAEVALISLRSTCGSDQAAASGGEQAQQARARVAAQLEQATERYRCTQERLDPSGQRLASILAEVGSAVLKSSQRMLGAVRDLAHALQQFCDLPEQQEAARLELAQAAAVRSCAYLQCTQMEQGGGPGAGQGAGSKRCSACRSVWYCGTECSHADWKAGHKRMCKRFAAAKHSLT